MFTRKFLVRSVAAGALVAVLSLSAFADTIRLKDGSIIKGKITGFNGGRFTVAIGEGPRRREMVFTAAEVESISFDTPAQSARTSNVPSYVPPVTQNPAPRVTTTENVATEQPRRTGSAPSRSSQPADTSAVNAPIISASTAKPIELNVKVLADSTANGWTNSGWVVRMGQRIRITGGGTINIGRGRTTDSGGLEDVEDASKLLKSVPTGALIAVIGDDNNDFIYVGTTRDFIADRDGSLFLGINEGNLNDNSGSFDVKVEIIP